MKKIEEIDMENDREQLQALIINETTDNLKYLDNVLDISLFLENIGIEINSNEIEQKENAELKKQVEELKQRLFLRDSEWRKDIYKKQAKINELEKQILEKDKEQNKKAIECLNEIIDCFCEHYENGKYTMSDEDIFHYIQNKINELEIENGSND